MSKNIISDILTVIGIALAIGGFAGICGLYALGIAGGTTLCGIAIGLIIICGIVFGITGDLDKEEYGDYDEEEGL